MNISVNFDYSHTSTVAIDSGKVGIAVMVDSTGVSSQIYYTEYKGGGSFKALENPFPGTGLKRSPHISYVNDTVFVACVLDSSTDYLKIVKRTGADQWELVLFDDNAWVETSVGIMGHAIINNRRPYLLRDN